MPTYVLRVRERFEAARHLRSYAAPAPRPATPLQISELVVELSPLLEGVLPPNVQLQFDLCGDVASGEAEERWDAVTA